MKTKSCPLCGAVNGLIHCPNCHNKPETIVLLEKTERLFEADYDHDTYLGKDDSKRAT